MRGAARVSAEGKPAQPMSHDGVPDIRTVTTSVIYEDSWMSLRRDEQSGLL